MSKTLKEKIESEILRLSTDHSEENTNLINNVLKPMLMYIQDHEVMVRDITRISGKHIT